MLPVGFFRACGQELQIFKSLNQQSTKPFRPQSVSLKSHPISQFRVSNKLEKKMKKEVLTCQEG